MTNSTRWILVLLALMFATTASAQRTTAGKDFWLAFPKNAKYEFGQSIKQSIVVTAIEATEVTVTAPALTQTGTILAVGKKLEKGESHTFDLDSSLQCIKSEVAEAKGLHVGSTGLITVIALSSRKASNDSYRIMPAQALGTSYMAIGYAPPSVDHTFTTQFIVIATEDNTSIKIELAGWTKQGRKSGHIIDAKLDRGQCYMVQGEGGKIDPDLTGSTVIADKPVAVLTGHSCAQVPYDRIYCDVLVEMAAPLASAGIDFVVPMMEEKRGYALRILATQPQTTIYPAQGGGETGLTSPLILDAGKHYDVIMATSTLRIRSDKPIIVAQYALSNEADSNKVGDPFMTLIAPTSAYVQNTTLSVPPLRGSWHHYLSVVCDEAAAESLEINGKSIPNRAQRVESGHYVFQIPVGPGTQTVTSEGKLAVYSYGFGTGSDNYDSYGTYCGPW